MPDRRAAGSSGRRRRARRAVASGTVLAVAVVLLGIGPLARAATAEGVSGEQLAVLAQRAMSDPAALRRLRQVDMVDGRPVDLGRALQGAQGHNLDARLRALSGGARSAPAAASEGAPPTAAEARADARRILDGRRYRPARTPRPFRGVLRRIGGWLRPVAEPLGRAWAKVTDNIAGQVFLVIAVIGLAALTSIRLVRRRTTAGVAAGPRDRRSRRESAEDMERRADWAEAEGNLDLAYRLRFGAGLVRLDQAGVMAFRASLTTGQVTASLRSPTLDGLAVAFDEIAYGGRRAAPADLDAARSGWPRVLEEAGSR